MLAKPTTKIQPAAVKAFVLCLLFVLSSQSGMLEKKSVGEELNSGTLASFSSSQNPLNYSNDLMNMSFDYAASCSSTYPASIMYEMVDGLVCNHNTKFTNSSIQTLSNFSGTLNCLVMFPLCPIL